MSNVGLCGEIFNCEGKVACATQKKGTPPQFGGVIFEILAEYPETDQFPAWTDIRIGNKRVRMNSELCEAPWWRMIDCLHVVDKESDGFPMNAFDDRVQKANVTTLGGQQFTFSNVVIDGDVVSVVDTAERASTWKPRASLDPKGCDQIMTNPPYGFSLN